MNKSTTSKKVYNLDNCLSESENTGDNSSELSDSIDEYGVGSEAQNATRIEVKSLLEKMTKLLGFNFMLNVLETILSETIKQLETNYENMGIWIALDSILFSISVCVSKAKPLPENFEVVQRIVELFLGMTPKYNSINEHIIKIIRKAAVFIKPKKEIY